MNFIIFKYLDVDFHLFCQTVAVLIPLAVSIIQTQRDLRARTFKLTQEGMSIRVITMLSLPLVLWLTYSSSYEAGVSAAIQTNRYADLKDQNKHLQDSINSFSANLSIVRSLNQQMTGTDSVPHFIFATTMQDSRPKNIGALMNDTHLPAMEFEGTLINLDNIKRCYLQIPNKKTGNVWISNSCIISISYLLGYTRILPPGRPKPLELPISDPYKKLDTMHLLCVVYFKGKRYEQLCLWAKGKQAVLVKEYLDDKLLNTYNAKTNNLFNVNWAKEFPYPSYLQLKRIF